MLWVRVVAVEDPLGIGAEHGQVVRHDKPDTVGDGDVVGVDGEVSKRDDLGDIRDLVRLIRVVLAELNGGFARDRDLALHGASHEDVLGEA